jgi:hypothetical protein
MSNTGKKIVLTLKQVNSVTFAPTGLTEPNSPADGASYIPPYNDFVTCPISYSLACPLPVFSSFTGSVGMEFSVYNSVVDNPNVSSIKVNAASQSVTHSLTFIPAAPTPNYYSGSISGLTTGTYVMSIQYVSGSSILSTCNYTSSVSVP